MPESYHGRLSRVRKPRVHITYKVDIGDAEVEKELPFVVGVIGDFSGVPTKPLEPISERKFVEIDRGNFNEVMKKMTPGLSLRVKNTMTDDGSEMAVPLKFESLDDFEPAQVARQVEPLRKLLDTRDRLRDLLTKVDRSPQLENLLEQVLSSTEDLKKLQEGLGIQDAPEGGK